MDYRLAPLLPNLPNHSCRVGPLVQRQPVHGRSELLPPPGLHPANNCDPFQGSAANRVQVIENVVSIVCQCGAATTNALEGRKVVGMIERVYALG